MGFEIERWLRAPLEKFTVLLVAAACQLEPSMGATGDLDGSFTPGVSGSVYTTAVQSDGSILVGGKFTAIGAVTTQTLARFGPDGSLDESFVPAIGGAGGFDPFVYCICVLADGRILIGGDFGTVNGVTREYVALLHSDGSLDLTFDAQCNGIVRAVVEQPDGKLLLGGFFTRFGTSVRNRIARLDLTGVIEAAFNPNADDDVHTLALDSGGRILVGGAFDRIAGQTRNFVARLMADGSIDLTFNPDANSNVNCLIRQPDGQVLIGGAFTSLSSVSRNSLARVDSSGVLDPAFDPTVIGPIFTMSLQSDGKLLIGGDIFSIGGVQNFRVGRVLASGIHDPSFNPSPNGTVFSLQPMPGDHILIGGGFSSLGGGNASGFARLANDTGSESLTVTATDRVEWTRGGSLPEASRVEFEASVDGVVWTPLGEGIRISNGWELDGLDLASTGSIRGIAISVGGVYGGGSSRFQLDQAYSLGGSPPIESWRLIHFGAPENSGEGADHEDPDFDGLNNLLEYALGLDPNLPSGVSAPWFEMIEGEPCFRFSRATAATDVSLVVKWSADLVGWSETGLTEEILSSSTPEVQDVKVSQTVTGSDRVFMRIEVAQP